MRPTTSRLGFLAVVALVAALTIPAATASAYVLYGQGCRYDPVNDNDGLGIGFDTGGSLYDSTERLSIEYAASDWNSAMTPQFTVVSYGSSTRDLRVQWSNLGVNTGGSLTRWCGSDHYTQVPRFQWGANATYYSTSEGRRQAIAIHEIGHSYGVAHDTTTGCGSGANLMYSDAVGKYDLCGWGAPRTDTVNGATAAHNGNW